MSSSTITSRLTEWIAGSTYEDVPRRVADEAKNQVLSMIAAVHAGHFSDAGRCVSRAVKEWTGGKEATLIPSGERTSVHYALAGNAALGMALEYDDYLLGARTGASAVLTTLALAEKLGSSGQEFLLAQVLANEVSGRAGLAVGFGPLDDQVNSFVHLLGSAVVAAKLLKLDRQQTAHALGLAMLQPNFLLPAGFYGSEAKVLSAALIAPIGVQAAELAASGLRGAHEVFEGERGFLRVFGDPPVPGAFKGYGKVWLTESLGYKVYPGSVYLGAIIDCVLGLVRQHHVDARKVHAVYVGSGPLTLAMDGRSAPYVHGPDSLSTTLNHSVAYNVAVAVLDRELLTAPVHARPHQGSGRVGAGRQGAVVAGRRPGAPRARARAAARRRRGRRHRTSVRSRIGRPGRLQDRLRRARAHRARRGPQLRDGARGTERQRSAPVRRPAQSRGGQVPPRDPLHAAQGAHGEGDRHRPPSG